MTKAPHRFLCITLFCICHIGLQTLSAQPGKGNEKVEEFNKESTKKNAYNKLSTRRGPDPYDFINQANGLMVKDPTQSLTLIEKALELSFETKDKRAEGYCYNTLGAIHYSNGFYTNSTSNYLKAIAVLGEVNDETGLYNSFKHIGDAYEGLKDYNKALDYYFVFLDKARAAKNSDDELLVMNSIARTYFNAGKPQLSLEYYKRVLALEEARKNNKGTTMAYSNLGKVYLQLKDTVNAVKHFTLSGELAEVIGYNEVVQTSYDNLGAYYDKQGKPDKKLEYQQKALTSNISSNDRSGENKANYDIGNTYLQLNQVDRAIPYLENSLNISEELGQLEQKGETYRALSEAYVKKGDYDQALKAFQRYTSINDSVLEERSKENKASQQLAQVLNAKDRTIQLLEKDQQLRGKQVELHEANNKRLRVVVYSLLAGMVIILLSAGLLYRSWQQKRRANQLLALKSLRSQMNPHFIFNSLNSVNSFISKNDERSANKYLSDFSRLMRLVMENSRYEMVPIASELQVLQLYLTLEHFRFKDKFDFKLKIDPLVEKENLQIPPMLIQPYIENAIWHGLRYKEEMGHLLVELKLEGKMLVGIIEDDGIGRMRSQELKTKNQLENKSTGLRNIQERLKIMNDLLKTSMTVEITDLKKNGQASGTRVVVNIPYKITEEALT